MGHRFHLRLLMVAGLLCLGTRMLGQAHVGDEVQFNLDGSITSSYAGGYGSENSDHGLGFGGMGNLNGSYYSPQFLSFNVSPFYNQSRDSAAYSAINDSSGVMASANIFSGSRFPGFVSYSDVYNGQSNYAVPGTPGFQTNGNTHTLGVGWSVNVPSLPALTMGYQQAGSDTSLYGIPTSTQSDNHSLFAHANYKLDGFQLNGGVNHSNESAQIPEIEAGEPSETANSDTTSYNFGMSRALPLQGNAAANFTRESSDYDSFGVKSSETADIVSGGLSLKPTDRFSTQFSGNYNSNIAGSLYQAINANGVLAPVSLPAGTSHSWEVFGQAQYLILTGLYVGGGVSHEQQLFLGTSYSSTAYSGFVGYGHDFLGGRFSSSATVTRSNLSDTGESMLGFVTLATFIRNIGRWNVGASFGYSENQQTVLLAYTSSGYNYSLSVTRPIRRLIWTGSASGSNTLITQQNTPSNFTRSYTTGLSTRWLGVSGGYSKSGGNGLLTSTGITVTPPGVPPPLLPTAVMFGGTSYTAGIGGMPIRGFTLNGSFVKAVYNTTNGTLYSNDKTEQINAYVRYKVRKIDFVAGYSRLLQGFSASGLPPTALTSYYAGISRWFKFF